MWRFVAIASLATGCTQLFGIDHIPFAGDANHDAPSDGSPDAAPLSLTVMVTGAGVVTDDLGQLACAGGECHGEYPPGTSVKLRPAGTSPSEFSLWGMACAGQNVNDGNPVYPDCTISSGGEVVVTADFEPPDVLNLVADPGGGGDGSAYIITELGAKCVSGQTCKINLPPNTITSTITAVNNTCSHLTMWRGGNCTDIHSGCAVTFHMNGFGAVITVNYTFSVSTGGATCTQ